MPLYEYACAACDTKFELLRNHSRADEPAECPTCGVGDGKRMVSVFASFSRSAGGNVQSIGGGNSCSGCSSGNCGSCH